MYISEPTFFPLDFWPAAIIHFHCGGREVANPTANGVLDTPHHKHIDLKIFLQTETIYLSNQYMLAQFYELGSAARR